MAGQDSFGAVLRRLREAAGLSQEKLAERASLSSHAVSALERGTRTRPYPHTVRCLADALGADEAERAALLAAVPGRARATRAAAAGPAPELRGAVLPVPATPLVGRTDDLARLRTLVERERLV
ncbi:helix-turn-helix domain-containing protein, partial [Nocardioides sp. GCM10027113]